MRRKDREVLFVEGGKLQAVGMASFMGAVPALASATGNAPKPPLRNGGRRSGAQPLDLRAAGAELVLDPLEAAIEMIDAVDDRLALAARPAMTSDTEARRSVAMTCAPFSAARR